MLWQWQSKFDSRDSESVAAKSVAVIARTAELHGNNDSYGSRVDGCIRGGVFGIFDFLIFMVAF